MKLTPEQEKAARAYIDNLDVRPPAIVEGVRLWEACLRLKIPASEMDRRYTLKTGRKPH